MLHELAEGCGLSLVLFIRAGGSANTRISEPVSGIADRVFNSREAGRQCYMNLSYVVGATFILGLSPSKAQGQ